MHDRGRGAGRAARPATVRGWCESWPSRHPAMGRSASSAAWTTAPGCGSTSRHPAIRRCGPGIASRSGARCARRPTARTASTSRVSASRRRSPRARCDRSPRRLTRTDSCRPSGPMREMRSQRALPEPAAGLAAGILIGLRERVDRELAADFTTTGLSHVVAISGWNIALVAGLVAARARERGRGGGGRSRPSPRSPLYTILAGASASVLRAAVMAGVALLARETGRPGTAARALAWAVVLLLVASPATVDRCRVPAVRGRDRRAPRLGHAARGPPPGAAATAARVRRRGARRLARRAGGDAPDRPALLRPACPAVAAPQPPGRAAGAARDGDRDARHGRRPAGGRRRPGARRHAARPAGRPRHRRCW